jgi:four helix bundle protein
VAKIQSHRDLLVWQKAMDLVVAVYALARQFPIEERYGLIQQVTRATVAVPANLAEGHSRGTRRDTRISCRLLVAL